MYTHVLEFNLRLQGNEEQEYLADAARTWPKLWGDIPGVTGTLLLSNAFGLGGDFEYQWRVDFDTLAVFSRLEEVVKSGKGGWREQREGWFGARTTIRAHVSRHVAGQKAYCAGQSGKDGAIHFILHSPSSESESSQHRVNAVGKASGVVSSQVLRQVMGSAVSHEQTWIRLDSLDSLDHVAAVERGIGSGQLFGEIRELDGSLFVGA